MKLYHSSGHSYLVCPRLLELDPRHGEHPSKWMPCRRVDRIHAGRAVGRNCSRDHEHEEPLLDPEGHTVNDFVWVPGCRPPTTEEHPSCELCGRPLVHADLDDPYAAEHLSEAGAGSSVPRL